jgi:hypothetical protein
MTDHKPTRFHRSGGLWYWTAWFVVGSRGPYPYKWMARLAARRAKGWL